MIGNKRTIGLFLVSLLFFTAAAAFSAPQAELWDRWTAHDPDSEIDVDHVPWEAFLRDYVVYDRKLEMNTAAYADVDRRSRERLDAYIDSLEAVPVSKLKRPQQKAFWINLYNAKTVQLVLEHYPVASIRKIKLSGPFTAGPWKEEVFRIEGESLSLNDVEHRILRPIWKDPRIHYAVNCASVGCPELKKRAFTAERMEEMLDEAARAYINSPRGVEFDKGILYLSSIYDWFEEDFGGNLDGVFAHLKKFADEETSEDLGKFSGEVEYRYDWSLNEAR